MDKDLFPDIMDKLDELEARLHGCVRKAENAVKKNAQLHIMLDSGLFEEMKQKADNQGISLSEWCRNKLRDDSQLDRIEEKLDLILEKFLRKKQRNPNDKRN